MRHLTSDAVTEVNGMELKADEEGAPALACYRNVETPNWLQLQVLGQMTTCSPQQM
jgi:hypothetical protein